MLDHARWSESVITLNNLWDHSKISSGRFVAGVNETKSKIVLLKHIGIFP